MAATENLYSQQIDQLTDIDIELFHLAGFCTALELLADNLELNHSTPASDAFWALHAGAERALTDAQACSARLHQLAQEGRT